ncbi:HD domain-containing protein [Lutimonas saemankumensis]|uniref:HD domain-containing protein n=1 Tax=Lutimonas saemankumensis TaxID=483016 RepID=UPI001CD6163B|nr:HD domain-containing protein [Lutimonas saemankumensis]MCA0933318.1 HD domain-containing protein [Lutimonas saemankumensis]
MKGYYKLRKQILKILENKLSKDLHYHGVHHTLDALETSDKYLRHIKIDPEDAKLLRLGILFHDIGFTETTVDHEKKGAEIAQKILKEYNFDQKSINTITNLILATEIPQHPQTLLEQIICDVDLDYLGRPDFYKISDSLFEELKVLVGLKDKNEWNKIQIRFLEKHQYHTEFAIKNRQPEKEKRIAELKNMIVEKNI